MRNLQEANLEPFLWIAHEILYSVNLCRNAMEKRKQRPHCDLQIKTGFVVAVVLLS